MNNMIFHVQMIQTLTNIFDDLRSYILFNVRAVKRLTLVEGDMFTLYSRGAETLDGMHAVLGREIRENLGYIL